MNIRVRLFASLKDSAARDSIDMDLPEGTTIGDLRQRLAGAIPGLAPRLGPALFAIDARYAVDAQPIPSGAEVACFPPVSGG